MTTSAPVAGSRIDFRIDAAQKEAIERAAAMLGVSVTQFATSTLLERAREVEQEHLTAVLSDRDRDLFLAMLDSDAKPNAALTKAAAAYRKVRKQQEAQHGSGRARR